MNIVSAKFDLFNNAKCSLVLGTTKNYVYTKDK